MPTLLQVNVTANSGSHGRITEELGELAISKGWRSIIAYGRWANESQSELIRIGSGFSIKEHGVESRLLDNHGLASRIATSQFIEKVKIINPDIIHLHNIHGYYLNYKLLFEFLNNTNIPVVWTLHDCWSFTGHCAHFVTANCEKWKTQCGDCPLIGDYPKSFVDRSRRNYDLKKALFSDNKNLHIVAVSDWLSEFVKQSFLKDIENQVIKNGVDLEVFRPIQHMNREKIQVVGVSSVWNENKGLYDFYRLHELLNPAKFEIVLVGLTKEQIKNLPKGITGIERTESVSELVVLYSSSSVLFNPTYADTFPTVNLEALACGTPVITYRTGGSPEAVTPETGWVVEQGDVESSAHIIEGLAKKNEQEIAAQRNACRSRAENAFNKNDRYKEYFDLYRKLLKQR